MSTVRQNFAQYLKSLQIIFTALVAGSVICLTAFYFLPQEQQNLLPEDGIAVRVPVLIVLLLAAGFFIGRNRIQAARNLDTLKEKMTAYRAALILRWALLEGSILLAGVSFFLSRYLILLGVAGIGLVVFLLFFPSRNRIITDLEFSSSEQAALDDPDTIVAEFKHRGP